MFDGLSLDPFTLFDDGLRPAEVGIGGRHVVEALVVAALLAVSLVMLALAGRSGWQCVWAWF